MTRRRQQTMPDRRRPLAAILFAAASLAGPAAATAQQASPAARAEHDLNRFAVIVAGQQMDIRCRILTRGQREDYARHVKVIRLGFEKMGLSKARLDDLEAAARNSADRGPARNCGREVADAVIQIGIMTAELGEQMAKRLAERKPSAPGR